ncbi:MAG TPA: RNA methyltransferase [Usitatibacter sp.]|nr:RNA methyltransferase [Usitatibacter sp.]
MSSAPILERIRVVLVRPSHPGNVGAAARAMKTMGLSDLRLVAPRRAPGAEALALAAGASDVLEGARHVDRLEEALAGSVLAAGLSARTRELSHPLRSLREAAPQIVAAAAGGPVALVFGNETNGLSNEEIGHCGLQVTIPANPAYASLNLAAAVQVACYEVAVAARSFEVARAAERAGATSEDVEALLAHWESAMVESGYLDPAQPGRLMERLRAMLARAGLERAEVKFLRGMLAAFEARMRR